MNCHNSNNYVSCESEFDSVSVPIAKKVDATIGSDVYIIESADSQVALEQTVTRLCGVTQESWDYSGVFYTNWYLHTCTRKHTFPNNLVIVIVIDRRRHRHTVFGWLVVTCVLDLFKHAYIYLTDNWFMSTRLIFVCEILLLVVFV